MAKKTSSVFYLRKFAETNAGTAATANIDISAYIDTLKGNVLKINHVWFEWTSDSGSPIQVADIGDDHCVSAGAQLCTETQTALQPLTNTSLIAKHPLCSHFGQERGVYLNILLGVRVSIIVCTIFILYWFYECFLSQSILDDHV